MKELPGKNIRITVPADKSSPYTVYAEGVSQGAYLRTEWREYDVFLDYAYPIVLFFTFRTHRRAFVCVAPERLGMNVYVFSCASAPLSVLSELRGRAYDRFKRSLRYLCKITDNRCRKFSGRFFWQLAYLAQNGLNSTLNLQLLANKYDSERNLALPCGEEKR